MNIRQALISFLFISVFVPLASASADDFWGCELNITGGQTLAVKAPQVMLTPGEKRTVEQVKAAGKVDATTDYWMTEEQLRQGLDAMIGMFANVSFSKTPKPPMSAAERKQKVDEAMKKDPRLMLFLMNCGNEQAGTNFAPGKDAKSADFPFHPGSYELVAKPTSHQMGAMMHINGSSGHESYLISGPGTFKLTQFDLHGLAGEFSFPAQQRAKSKKILVSGRFHLHCIGQKCAK